ncbi:hypothetical protein [Dawidia soli]|uniref:Uncharacterized protein n=1 Tax=Dawidia soli TaxID=2782352 RepID=A0AAP2GC22_9BACT|nr:hypothetical protein [Dawidia soli]MBT1685804.1 hypothetical protein [Dawidia soli]
MEFTQLNRLALAAVLTFSASAFAVGQCKATKVDYDLVDISELAAFQKQKTEVETSDSYIDIFYLIMGAKPIGYRLAVGEDGFYKLTRTTKENASEEISSGVFKVADIEKQKSINILGTTYFLGKCKGITSSESAEFFLVKKIGTVRIYSLDGELQRLLKEDDTNGMAYWFELMNYLIKKKS